MCLTKLEAVTGTTEWRYFASRIVGYGQNQRKEDFPKHGQHKTRTDVLFRQNCFLAF